MTDPNYTHITLVVDRSGSMNIIRTDAQGAINQFIRDQKAAPGRATLTLAQFDSVYDVVYDHVDLDSVPDDAYVLRPRNMTALLDAWGRAMTSTGEFLGSLREEERPGHVIFVVVTDGAENASCEFTRDQIKDMTERQRTDYSWDIVFLAANMDAVSVGAGLGVAAGSSLTYGATGQGAHASYQALSNVVTAVRSGTVAGVTFSEEARKAAVKQ